MKKAFLITSLLLNSIFAFNQQLLPISKIVGKLNITVDPRMELLSAVQVVSDYSTINRETPYSRELMQFFSKDSTHQASIMTHQLENEYGFAYDAPVNLMLCLSQVPELTVVHPFTDRLIERANGKSNLEKYATALHHFATESNYTEFWNSKKSFFQKMVYFTADDLADFAPVDKLENYYNESKNSYTVTLSPAFAGGYGIRIPSKNNNLDVYACLNVWEMKDSIPYYNKLGLSYFIWHEFSHSFVNPLTEKYKTEVEASSKLYTPLEKEMKAMAYNNWGNCVNEHIIRAIYIRLLTIYRSENEASAQLDQEKLRHFVYIEPLIGKLKQFELERKTKNVTFSQYYPTLLSVFDSLKYTDNENLLHPLFSGPIRNVIGSNKIVIIYPTNDPDTLALKNVFNYTSRIHKMKSDVSKICSDREALKMDLSDYSIMAYGTIESNLFLKKHKETFPFRIIDNAIYTDKKQEGTNLRIITCLPNPYNNKKGMLVNTSTSNKNISGVSNPFTDDYIVFENIENIIQKGEYKKGKIWSF